jgi:hypothetical protein
LDVQSLEKPSSRDRLERFIKLAPVLLASWTAIFLLNGRSYREGYLEHFRLNGTMFDGDISDQVTLSVTAWVQLVFHILHLIEVRPIITVVVLLSLFVSPLLLSLYFFLRAQRLHRHRIAGILSASRKSVLVSKRSRANRIRRILLRVFFKHRIPSWVKSFRHRVWTVFSFGYLGYTGLTFVGFILISIVVPFRYLGDDVAIRDQAARFKDQPSVILSDPKGKSASYKIILCAEHFCGLYSDKEIITAPLSAITWGTSEPVSASTAEGTKRN